MWWPLIHAFFLVNATHAQSIYGLPWLSAMTGNKAKPINTTVTITIVIKNRSRIKTADPVYKLGRKPPGRKLRPRPLFEKIQYFVMGRQILVHVTMQEGSVCYSDMVQNTHGGLHANITLKE